MINDARIRPLSDSLRALAPVCALLHAGVIPASALASVPEALVITNQPQGQTNFAGESVTLGVGVSGSPVFYQWQKEGNSLPGATNAILIIPNAQPADSGAYTVFVFNAQGSVTSSIARILIVADILGPRLLSATVRETGNTNTVDLLFSEPLLASTATARDHYTISSLDTGQSVAVSNALYSSRVVRLAVSGSNWMIGGRYVLTVTGVRDVNDNVIAPDTAIGISWPYAIDVLSADAVWSFHAAATFDTGIFDESWWTTNDTEGAWWSRGRGLFCGGPVSALPCLGPFQTETGYQPEPALFRTTFLWPTDLGNVTRLRLVLVVDDGTVFYLNGREIFRYNMFSSAGPPSAETRTDSAVAIPSCHTNFVTVSNLRAGTNWLAVAVCDSAGSDGQMAFGLQLSANGLRPAVIEDDCPPSCPALSIRVLAQGLVRLSWQGGGYALESATDLNGGRGSYPFGPWQPVPNMSNPYTNQVAGSQRFFRLKR